MLTCERILESRGTMFACKETTSRKTKISNKECEERYAAINWIDTPQPEEDARVKKTNKIWKKVYSSNKP